MTDKNIKKEIRCNFCNKLLMKVEEKGETIIEIKCPRCKKIVVFICNT